MILKAYSKLTLSLKVYKKTKNENKHRIEGVFGLYKKIYDEITITPSTSDQDEINYFYKNKPIKITNCNVKKTLNYLRNNFNIPFYKCMIYKNIPIGSGIGGSATDCAAVIKYVFKKNKMSINKLNVKDIALNLGSDIPFFLSGHK
jgi:4-diphosphocytidyl-2-C-methyl-D-erythritol kinase